MKRIFTLLLLTVTLISTAQESVLLRLNYKKGDAYLMKMTLNQNMGQGVMLVNMGMDMKIDVKEAKDKIYDTEMSFVKMTMEMKGNGMDIKFDTDANDEDLDEQGKAMKSQIAPVLDMVIGAKINDLGETIDMKIIKGEGRLDQFKQSNNTVAYPKDPVKVGTTWTEKKENKGMNMNYTYTVKSINENAVMLTVAGDVTGAATGSFKGLINVNRLTGVPEKGDISMDMEVMGQPVDMTIAFSFSKINDLVKE